jgi:hypothetical protein
VSSRFPLKLSPVWRPVLFLYGATRRSAYVDVGPDALVARMGWNKIELPRDEIEWARRSGWPWWRGVGFRGSVGGSVGVIGAYSPVVRIHLRRPRLTLLSILPTRMRDLYVSVEDPEGLIAALRPG